MSKPKVEPLKSKTMTLDELQLATLEFIRKVRRQLNRMPYDDGLSDNEFMDQVAEPLQREIEADRDVMKMARKNTSVPPT